MRDFIRSGELGETIIIIGAILIGETKTDDVGIVAVQDEITSWSRKKSSTIRVLILRFELA